MNEEQNINIMDVDNEFDIEKNLSKIFLDAIQSWASDIHILPEKSHIFIKFRIEWKFKLYKIISNKHKEQLISRIKILSNLRFDEQRLPQDWSITIYLEWWEVYLRISTLPTLYWEKIVMRVLNSNWMNISLEALWFHEIYRSKVEKYLREKNWLVLVVWATWSGKSTTLLTILKHYDPKEFNITTLEDPIEYRIQWVTHSQINHRIWFDFSVWLRSILRQDPDIIMVWEIRDKETAKLCMEAAITWHMVFSTIHANSSLNCIQRLSSLWVDEHLIAAGLKLIISQNLIRKLCPKCKKEYSPNWGIINFLNNEISKFKKIDENLILYNHNPSWCGYCNNTWYKWRVGIFEILEITKWIKKIILSQSWEQEIEEQGIADWYLNIKQDWLIKVVEWLISLKELNEKLGNI